MKNPAQPSSLPASVNIEPRRLDFQSIEGKPRYWHPVAVFTHLLTSASLFFPEGERFFVRSVQYYAGDIKDPQLRQDIAGFMQQETIHGEAHERYNYDIADQGYPYLRRIERYLIKGIFTLAQRLFPKQVQLALTVCLEHVTATLASSLFFLVMVLYVTGRMLKTDGLLFDGRTWREARIYARERRAVFKAIGKDFIQFFRRDFHPWQLDNRHDIEMWKKNYAETGRAA